LACHSPTTAPVGSATNAILPASPTSIAGISTWPPAGPTFSSVASTSSTARYVFHIGGMPSGAPGAIGAIAATVSPFSSAMEYVPPCGIGWSS
jgi:hypothetical protein